MVIFFLDSEYDFIVIGSGSSGSVIASRLSEVPDWNILLLEAGERVHFMNQVPIMAPLYQVTHYNWNYTMEKQEDFCLAMEEQRCAWPRGKALGGTTVLNYMIYTRGHPNDYDKWEKENPGWGYQEVLPYFLKSENCNLGKGCYTNFHSRGGYLNVEGSYSSELTDAFIAAGRELGYKQVDYNTDSVVGFSRMQANIKFGRRHSASAAFLGPASQRPNLKIVTGATVTKININPLTREAYGVEFSRGKGQYFVNASKEVIVSAGVLNSPQLLMLSGIGPLHHLLELGIEPVQDLPVGKQLYDHLGFMGLVFTINRHIEPRQKMFEPTTIFEWMFRGTGFLASLGGIEAIAYISTKNTSYPDIELLLAGIGTLQFDRGTVSRRGLRITEAFYENYFEHLEKIPCVSILPVLLHPRSNGELKLASSDTYEPPKSFGNYLTDQEGHDLEVLLKGIRLTQKLMESEAFQQYGAKIYDKPVPGCENFFFDTDQYWECAVRHLGVTLHHQIGTCRMGNGSNSVVDHRLRVRGLKGLRVADTSVIPVTISAHTSAPAMMVGEKASDMIKEDWGAYILDY
ncbi:glucose dehydrogenase [FAD, quinone]-like [Cylas formicarius]|uniref:glucose dehydrogenase [FAD, quinone]-like n=1 Tax=Cylas formicarius TaxID=197179 RepID=UPI0029587AF9|nr:glucose dehydrogenase [FAD, quinone]-like [Cylas formicarius]